MKTNETIKIRSIGRTTRGIAATGVRSKRGVSCEPVCPIRPNNRTPRIAEQGSDKNVYYQTEFWILRFLCKAKKWTYTRFLFESGCRLLRSTYRSVVGCVSNPDLSPQGKKINNTVSRRKVLDRLQGEL